jgi:hypothetical protein
MHSCAKHKNTLGTARHGDLISALMTLARSVGFFASREPNDHAQPEGLNLTDEQYNDHADILLLKHDQRLYVDVAVTRPTAASNLTAGHSANYPLQAAARRARMKHRKYDAICKLNGYTMVPFIVESTGAIAIEGRRLLRQLSEQAQDSQLTPKQWLAHAYNYLSVVLQKGNARLNQGGVHAQSIDRSRWEHKMAAQQRWLQSRGHHSTSAARAHSGASRSHEPVCPSSSSSVSSNHSEYEANRPTRPPKLRKPVRRAPGRRAQPTVKSVIVRALAGSCSHAR